LQPAGELAARNEITRTRSGLVDRRAHGLMSGSSERTYARHHIDDRAASLSSTSKLQQCWQQRSCKEFVDLFVIDRWSLEEWNDRFILRFRCSIDRGWACRGTLTADESVSTEELIEGIVSEDSVQRVVAQSARQVVLSGTAEQCVISAVSVEQVLVRSAEDSVGAVSTADRICAAAANQHVSILTAFN
jgi:hypothetical protein